jgi:hypothetical protein
MIPEAAYAIRQIGYSSRHQLAVSKPQGQFKAEHAGRALTSFRGGGKLRLTTGAGGHQTLPHKIKASKAMFHYRPQMTPAVDRAPHTFREDSQSTASYSSPHLQRVR